MRKKVVSLHLEIPVVMKRLFLLIIVLVLGLQASAKDKEWTLSPVCAQEPTGSQGPLTLTGYGFYDMHYATGSVGGAALLLDWHVAPAFRLGGGIEYASSNRIAARLSGEATLLTTAKKQRLTLENSYLWRHFPSLNIQEFTGALQVGWHARHVDLKMGLCNRYIAELVQRDNGGMGTIFEPMNVMFAVEGWWNNSLEPQKWNAGLRWSNYNDFIIERVANWFFSAKGFYAITDKTVLMAEVGAHPAGSLNLTASNDGWFMKIGGIVNIGKEK